MNSSEDSNKTNQASQTNWAARSNIRSILFLIGIWSIFAFGWIAGIGPKEGIRRISSLLPGNASATPSLVKSYYNDRISQFDLYGKPARIVMAGDSITCLCEWAELLPTRDVANRGIGGDTSEGLLKRLPGIIKLHPEKVFVMIGMNDLLGGIDPEKVSTNQKLIIQTLRKEGITVGVFPILYAGKRYSQVNSKVTLVDKQLEEFCASESITFIDLNTRLSENAELRPDCTGDDLHVNGHGFVLWRDMLAAYL
ncbi:MAG: GDSL-type esterase/lipase family protein [Candidatus Ozemobacteraceae bacterium]